MPLKENQEVTVAKRAGMYKGEKRRKELSRLKKQEEKRQRRIISKKADSTGDEEIINPEGETVVDENEKGGDASTGA
jgi:hypothetical protein